MQPTDAQPASACGMIGPADLSRTAPQAIVNWLEAEGPLDMLDPIRAAFPGVAVLEEYRAWCAESEDWEPYGWDHAEHAINCDILARTGADWNDPQRPCFAQDPQSEGDLVLAPLSWFQARESELERAQEVERLRHTQTAFNF